MFALAGRDDGGGQLRQRCTDGDDRQADYQVADPQGLGDFHRPPDQHARTGDEQHQAHHQPGDGPAQGHGPVLQFPVYLLAQVVGLVVQPQVDGPAHQGGEHRQQHKRLGAGDGVVPQQQHREPGNAEQQRQLLAQDLGLHGDGLEQGGQPEDQGDIGYVGTVGIAQGDARVALGRRDGRYHHLRRRGAEADDDHAYKQRRHAEVAGDGCGALHEAIGAPHQQREADDY